MPSVCLPSAIARAWQTERPTAILMNEQQQQQQKPIKIKTSVLLLTSPVQKQHLGVRLGR